MPRSLPGSPRTYTYVSGLAELAALIVAVFPANVQMALDWRNKPLPYRIVAFARLPMQLPLVLWSLNVRRR